MDTKNDEQDSIYGRASREEIEEALRWLEELSARNPSLPLEGAKLAQAPLPNIKEGTTGNAPTGQEPESPSTLESPFYGILDTTEDDLPEWLREMSTTSTMAMLENGEMESRLDWLAKMAKRESIEELPTLEWRRLSGPRHEVPLPKDEAKFIMEAVPSRADDETGITNPAASPVESEVNPPEPLPESLSTETYQAAARFETGESKSFDDLDAAMAWIEELAASQEAPIEDLPSVADRALASKLMVEAGLEATGTEAAILPPALSQLDELEAAPSYASDEDPADTIVLMETIAAESHQFIQEAEPELTAGGGRMPENLPSEIAEEILDQSNEAKLMAEEKIAAKPIVIFDEPSIEEMTPDEMVKALPEESGLEENQTPAMSFEEAIAYLEGMAQSQPGAVNSEEFAGAAFGEPPILEELGDSEWTAAEFKVEETEAEETNPDIVVSGDDDRLEGLAFAGVGAIIADEIFESSDEFELSEPALVDQSVVTTEIDPTIATESNGTEPHPLEEKLLAIDSLALPAGKKLDDVVVNFSPNHLAPFNPDELLSALDWLEHAIEDIAGSADDKPFISELADEDLIQLMPEDPDEALAWLVRLANDELEVPPSQPSAPKPFAADRYQPAGKPDQSGSGAVVGSGISEADAGLDLMEMPEDPDAAMAWLESLAAIETRPEQVSEPVAPFSEAAKEQPMTKSLAKEPVVEPAGRKPAPSRRATRKATTGTDWVDLLKPLDKK